jgi:GNAT superfamily N-acetyltransferase
MEPISKIEDNVTMLKFEPIRKFKHGLIFRLLSQSFAELINDELEEKIKQFDKEIFENPDTVGACVFVSTLNGQAIGMASWDPRQGPEIGIIGYNCILPEFGGRGFGKAQINEVLRRFKAMRFKKAIVTTGDHPFFLKATKIYLACGFKETRRHSKSSDQRYGSIDYEIEM